MRAQSRPQTEVRKQRGRGWESEEKERRIGRERERLETGGERGRDERKREKGRRGEGEGTRQEEREKEGERACGSDYIRGCKGLLDQGKSNVKYFIRNNNIIKGKRELRCSLVVEYRVQALGPIPRKSTEGEKKTNK